VGGKAVTLLESTTLGILQGLTEFLPVSSSGHLVLMQTFMGIGGPVVFFDVLLHIGTLAAVLVVFRKNIAAIFRESATAVAGNGKPISELPHAWFMLMIIVGSVPAGIIGILLEDTFEELFSSPLSVGFFLLVTGMLLFPTRRIKQGARTVGMITMYDAIIIGMAQAMAITPGISRSGATIAVALFLGLERETAVKYSFLLSIPAIAGAVLLKSLSMPELPANLPNYAAGMISAFGVGLVALLWLVRLVNRGKLEYFAYYCWGVGISVVITNLL
jgi:undecaprenyl-diphosphatase